jgi:hypothetical protein
MQAHAAGPLTRMVTIPDRFNGPSGSAHGGYTCGIVAGEIEGPARITLKLPPPLRTPLWLRAEGGDVRLQHEDRTLATGAPAGVELELLVSPPDLETARKASAGFLGFTNHPFPDCFVCGTRRAAGDSDRPTARPSKAGSWWSVSPPTSSPEPPPTTCW